MQRILRLSLLIACLALGEAAQAARTWLGPAVSFEAPRGWETERLATTACYVLPPAGAGFALVTFLPAPEGGSVDDLCARMVKRLLGQRVRYEVEGTSPVALAGYRGEEVSLVIREPAPEFSRVRLQVLYLGRRALIVACTAPLAAWQLRLPAFDELAASLELAFSPDTRLPVPPSACRSLDFSTWKHPALPFGLALSLPRDTRNIFKAGCWLGVLPHNQGTLWLAPMLLQVPMQASQLLDSLAPALEKVFGKPAYLKVEPFETAEAVLVKFSVLDEAGAQRVTLVLSMQDTSALAAGFAAPVSAYPGTLRLAAKAFSRLETTDQAPVVQFAVPEAPFAKADWLLPLALPLPGPKLVDWRLPPATATLFAKLDKALGQGEFDPYDTFEFNFLYW